MFEALIGNTSEKVLTQIERGAVKKFAEAINEHHPIYIDHDYGKKTKYGNNIAPPTFPRTLDYGTIDGLNLPEAGLIHGEQTFDYVRPLIVGESLYCYSKVESYIEKQTQSGLLGFLTIKNVGEALDDTPLFISTIVIVLTEKVREGMRDEHH